MSYTINLQNFSDEELTGVLIACLLLFIFISWKIFEQMKGVDFFSFLFPGKNLSKDQKLFFGKSLKKAIPGVLLSLLSSVLIYLVFLYVKRHFT